jgi:hypothetical protein
MNARFSFRAEEGSDINQPTHSTKHLLLIFEQNSILKEQNRHQMPNPATRQKGKRNYLPSFWPFGHVQQSDSKPRDRPPGVVLVASWELRAAIHAMPSRQATVRAEGFTIGQQDPLLNHGAQGQAHKKKGSKERRRK